MSPQQKIAKSEWLSSQNSAEAVRNKIQHRGPCLDKATLVKKSSESHGESIRRHSRESQT